VSGADWLVGDVGKRETKPKRLEHSPTPLEIDQAERFLEDAAGDGKQLVAGMKKATAALDALRSCGLTGEALVVLVQAKCGYCVNHGKNKPSPDVVQGVLEGLFRLGEFVR
jgi:hypothetical protein